MEKKMDDLTSNAEVERLRTSKGAYFVCGEGGDRNENGLPESIFICPALGSDITVKYKRVD